MRLFARRRIKQNRGGNVKLIITAILTFAVLAASSAAQNVPSIAPLPSVKGRTLGEALVCPPPQKGRGECDPKGDWEFATFGPPAQTLTYKSGKLVKMIIIVSASNNETTRIAITDKFGQPTSIKETEIEKGGAHFTVQVFKWELPNGHVMLSLVNNPVDQSAIFTMMTPAEHALILSKKKTKKNDLD
jgi:hypothetical protein